MDRALLEKDPHFAEGCAFCHKGNEKVKDKDAAHKGLVKRPSDDLTLCGRCHGEIAKKYGASLHYTTSGLKHGVSPRFSASEKKIFNEKVFPKACNSCHATCGDCHVKSPVIGGVNMGLIKGHAFVRKDEGKTCALCHGGRVYPEFTGEYGGTPDVHYQKGMICLDCHRQNELHGDGTTALSRHEVKGRPTCIGCHPAGSEKSDKSRAAHAPHAGKLSCASCHSGAPYRNCTDCHLGAGATAKPGFILGKNPRNPKEVTTLRVIPTVRDTFKNAGIAMESYDALPNYWPSAPHNIKKRTERTRSCDVCHRDQKDFLTEQTLIKDGSTANRSLIHTPRKLENQEEKK
ncbi:hypothetical protein GEOBC_00896 [Geobacteraceae bacterium]|nr:hypothetical protein GEOBC_00896 [Geobacteraceae bacterium]